MKNKTLSIAILFLILLICIIPTNAFKINISKEIKTFEYSMVNSSSTSCPSCVPCQPFHMGSQVVYPINTSVDKYPSHIFYKREKYKSANNGYKHIIDEIITPFVIAGKKGEWLFVSVIAKTLGDKSKRVYITLWCEARLIDYWESEEPIEPGVTGENTYPIILWRNFRKNNLNFRVITGHLEGFQRVKDDERRFSIKIGKTDAVIDQMSTKISTNVYVEMTKKTGPMFQEITVGKSGQLHSIDVKPPLSTPWASWGCGANCEMNILIVKWFKGWTKTPWNRNNFDILGEKTISWKCYNYPLPIWVEAYFADQNISFKKGDKFILMFEGKTFTDKCGNRDSLCLGFSVGPADNYPKKRGLVGFWDEFAKKWQTWPTDDWDHLFRVWIKQGRKSELLVPILDHFIMINKFFSRTILKNIE